MHEDHHTPIVMKTSAAVAAWADMVQHDIRDLEIIQVREDRKRRRGSVAFQVAARIVAFVELSNDYDLYSESIY